MPFTPQVNEESRPTILICLISVYECLYQSLGKFRPNANDEPGGCNHGSLG